MNKKTTSTSHPADEQDTAAYGDLPVGPTGRFLVTMAPGSQKKLIKHLKDAAGLSAASTADFDDAAKAQSENQGGAEALIFEHLSVAIVGGDDAEKIQAMEAAAADDGSPIVSVEPEHYVQALGDQGFLSSSGRDYVRGYRDGVAGCASRLLGAVTQEEAGEGAVATTFADTPQFTWGLQATRVHASNATGLGIRVAVLDTGFDLLHPDFVGRTVISATFVGQPVQDLHGHGTHVVGTALGDRMLAGGVRRYGCARQGAILVGKVLTNAGSGQDAGILAGINWAIQNGARIISMSLGSPVTAGTPPSAAYENAGRAALNAGSLIIAAAGNDGNSRPVSRPANSPSIMAVGAVDPSLRLAPFSCTGINPGGGEVNIVGPGVNVFSSVPMPGRYGFKSGTSMATPHVSGIAALWAQRTGLRGAALWNRLVSTALNIGLPSVQAGKGLVQAP